MIDPALHPSPSGALPAQTGQSWHQEVPQPAPARSGGGLKWVAAAIVVAAAGTGAVLLATNGSEAQPPHAASAASASASSAPPAATNPYQPPKSRKLRDKTPGRDKAPTRGKDDAFDRR